MRLAPRNVGVQLLVNPRSPSAYYRRGATATVATRTAEGGTAVAVADGNLAGTISASKSDVVEGTIHSIDVTAAVATVTVEIAFPRTSRGLAWATGGTNSQNQLGR